jgi:hypothetical protein
MKLENIKVGDILNIASEESNGHDFKFVNAKVTQIINTKNLFGSSCIDLVFGNRRERFSLPCNYVFEVQSA